jgi:photosystem II stability/assembly factor-like uncharacterized protein
VKTVTTFLFLSFLILKSNAQCWDADTIWAEPQFTQLFDIAELNNDSYIAVGFSYLNINGDPDTIGIIFKSNDSGKTWERKARSLKFPVVKKVFFPTEQIGYVVGDRSCILKSIDSGETWEKLTVPFNGLINFNDLHFFSANHGILLTDNPNFSGALLFETYDGGETWENRSYEYNEIGSQSFFFLNENIGFSASAGIHEEKKIFKTIDGGKTWELNYFRDTSINIINSITFVDSLNGWACATGGRVYNTIDGGNNWFIQKERISTRTSANGILFDIKFQTKDTGWIVGEKGTIFKTDNGGKNWRLISPLNEPPAISNPHYIFRKVHITHDNFAWITGTLGYIYNGRIFKCNLNQAAPACLNSRPEILNDDPDSTSVFPTFTWSPLDTGCFDGYYLNIGTTPEGMDILAYENASTDTFITITEALPYETTLYATILPYNCAKVGEGCQSLEFTTQDCPKIEIFIDTTLNQGDTFLSSILVNDTLITEILQTPLGCDSTFNYLVTVKPVSTKDIHDLTDNLLIYPNPAKDQVHFELTNNEKIQLVKLYTQSGKELNTTVLNGQDRGTIDIKAFPSGIYYLQIISSNLSLTKKMFIKN